MFYDRKSATAEPESAQMTIFYAGQVLVFNDFPAEKAREVMLLASKGCSQNTSGYLSSSGPEKINTGSSIAPSPSIPASPAASPNPQGLSSGTFSIPGSPAAAAPNAQGLSSGTFSIPASPAAPQNPQAPLGSGNYFVIDSIKENFLNLFSHVLVTYHFSISILSQNCQLQGGTHSTGSWRREKIGNQSHTIQHSQRRKILQKVKVETDFPLK